MAKIRMVGATCEGEGISGVLLDICFTNGQVLILPLAGKARDPSFMELLVNNRLFHPKTDGERVYWNDGPSLTCAEIFQMVKEETE
jgi:hypothetical protein